MKKALKITVGVIIGIIILIFFIMSYIENNGLNILISNLSQIEKDKSLESAVGLGQRNKVFKLVEQGANVDYVEDGFKLTNIQYLIVKEDYSLAQYLVEKSNNIDLKSSDGDTALTMTLSRVGKDNDEASRLAKLLIEKGANVNVVTNSGFTPLWYAALNENEELVKLLVEKGADVNFVTSNNVKIPNLRIVDGCVVLDSSKTSSNSTATTDSTATNEAEKKQKISAWTCAEKLVQDNLKAPSTAKFPLADVDKFVTSMGGSKYKVSAYVDSENSFGAKIRTNFSVTIILTGDGKGFTYENLQFDN